MSSPENPSPIPRAVTEADLEQVRKNRTPVKYKSLGEAAAAAQFITLDNTDTTENQ